LPQARKNQFQSDKFAAILWPHSPFTYGLNWSGAHQCVHLGELGFGNWHAKLCSSLVIWKAFSAIQVYNQNLQNSQGLKTHSNCVSVHKSAQQTHGWPLDPTLFTFLRFTAGSYHTIVWSAGGALEFSVPRSFRGCSGIYQLLPQSPHQIAGRHKHYSNDLLLAADYDI
jgi:hypothetical protein